MAGKAAEAVTVAGLHLFKAALHGGNALFITTPKKDFSLAAKKAKKLTTDKKSEFYGASLNDIVYEGTIDA